MHSVLTCSDIQHTSHLKHPSFSPSSRTHWLSTTRGGVENLLTPGIRQENIELIAFHHSLDNTRHTKTLYYPHLTSTFLGAKQPRTKWCHTSQPWSNNNILLSDDSIDPTNKIKVYTSLILNTNFIKRTAYLVSRGNQTWVSSLLLCNSNSTFIKLLVYCWNNPRDMFSQILHPSPTVASTPNRMKTNHCWLNLPHTLNHTTPLAEGLRSSLQPLRLQEKILDSSHLRILLINTRNKKKIEPWIHAVFSFPLVTPGASGWTHLLGR